VYDDDKENRVLELVVVLVPDKNYIITIGTALCLVVFVFRWVYYKMGGFSDRLYLYFDPET
jgi:hypothetical protein